VYLRVAVECIQLFMFLYSVPDQTSWTPRRSASSGNVLDNTPGLSQRLSQTADPSLFRVPSESAVQPAPPPPPLPATNTDGLAEVLRSAQLRKTPKVSILFVGYLQLRNE